MKTNNPTFIQDLAAQVLRENDTLEKVTIIFPNRRAGLFFRKALSELIDKPIWMPQVSSLEDFVIRNQPLRKMETLEGVCELFSVYQTFQQQEETLDQFYFWGEMILRDFNEIDHYLIDPKKLFTSIKTQKELDEEFYFLDEHERKVIQSFWASFLPKSSKTQEAFLETWKILLPIYEQYTAKLIEKGMAYTGLIYRRFTERLDEQFKNFDRKIYFAGFNALTFTEEKIFKFFVGDKGASVIWDIDDYYFSNRKQEAGFFFREYARDTILARTFEDEQPKRFSISKSKSFVKTGVSLEVGQAKGLAEELNKLIEQPDFTPENTVIVLPQETMLFPVLHSLPDSISKVNITMGFPLNATPVFSLIESLLFLQNPPRKSEMLKTVFYYKPLIQILEHPLVSGLEEKKVKTLIANVRKRNQIMIYQDDLEFEEPLLKHIFIKASNPFEYLLQVLKILHERWQDESYSLELEYISRFYEHIQSLGEVLGKSESFSYDFLIKLFRRLARSIKIPFTGEPLDGLQIMGILETRNLDFENVFVLNMNEDAWPAPPKRGSFIPYNIRRAFELPVQDHHDAIYAYLFYRLLQRATNIHFFYNTVSEFNLNGEISRLVQQLEVESGFEIKPRILSNPVKTPLPEAIRIEKSEAILRKMDRYLQGYPGKDASQFTPSALNIYLDCRLKFYFRYAERMYEPDDVQEEMDPMVFGNILHNTMELIYKSFIKTEKRDVVHPQDFFGIKASVDGALKRTFLDHYGIKNEKRFKPEGRTLIAWDILRKFINQILDLDEQYAPFRIIGLEASTRDGYSINHPIAPNGNKISVRLKGVIDRLDLKEGKVRVLDYKTGKDTKEFKSVESLMDRDAKDRNKAVFQVFFYSWLFMHKYDGDYETIEPGILNSTDLFDKKFDSRVLFREPRKSGIPVQEYRRFNEPFEEELTNLLTEIFDKNVPFDQTDDEKKCGFCDFRNICSR